MHLKEAAIILLIWNIMVMIVYGLDKHRARRSRRRIRESTLLIMSFLLGGAGAIFGMVLFNHKTSKTKFRLLVPLSVILNVAFLLILRY